MRRQGFKIWPWKPANRFKPRPPRRKYTRKWTQKPLLRARLRLCLFGQCYSAGGAAVRINDAVLRSMGCAVRCSWCSDFGTGMGAKMLSPPGDGWAPADEKVRGAGGGPTITAAGEQSSIPRPVRWQRLRVRHQGCVLVLPWHRNAGAGAPGPQPCLPPVSSPSWAGY